ncbi:38K protein [Drosophila innubila nudivirus]|uniref:38K protein n=1 Tax=Drosophila innubila nudivirus TaxID=2057187 RepID=A0A2H4UX82_9VIRU|nr:38K protein [Drosophila innubila nudivirus]ATZ81527.1 38K protein [Drosophila innubila nudivirus]
MSDPSKPDLIVHPKYFKSILNLNLTEYYNVVSLADLKIILDIRPILITDKNSMILTDVQLEPYFNYYTDNKPNLKTPYTSSKPENTSFYYKRHIPIYRFNRNGPRYIIWPNDEVLTICGTFVNRIMDSDLYLACEHAKKWAFTITKTKSIIVFDLDDTLINNDTGRPFKCSHKLLKYARDAYDLVVLYSHGSNLHVDDKVQYFITGNNAITFDLILSNNCIDKKSTKNLLSLYNYFPQTRFQKPTLVDDSLYNWSPEYEKFIVPSVKETLRHALKYIS